MENSLIVRKFSESEDKLLKDYLYRLSMDELKDDRISVTRMMSLSGREKDFLRHPYVSLDRSMGLNLFGDDNLIVSVREQNKEYELFFVSNYSMTDGEVDYKVSIAGFTAESDSPDSLFHYIKEQSIRHSIYKGKILSMKEGNITLQERMQETTSRTLEDIYLPESYLHQLRRFIHALKNSTGDGKSLRFLLNGRPGTGKTELTRAIISAVAGDTTILIAQGADCPVNKVFDFISLFPNSLLIIDDIDFIAEDRKVNIDKISLGNLLQVLDGYIPNDVFVIATTNDYRLVDEAASRPGRFDLILDIPEIETHRYDQLIRRETDDEEIISLFTEGVRSRMKSSRITGAFIVNLIKQLKGLKEMEGNISPEGLENILDLTLRGAKRSHLSPDIGFN